MLKNSTTETIETSRLILRKFTYDDAMDMLCYWISDPLVQYKYREPVYTTKEEVSTLLHKYITSYDNPYYYRWAIISKETNECIGQIAYFLVDINNHFGEIEYCIGRSFQEKGFATEATKAIIDYGFHKINFHKIQICHIEDNLSSKKVIEKCGFKYEGTIRDCFYDNSKYYNKLCYSIINKTMISDFINLEMKELNSK